MATINPSLGVAEMALKDILKNLGIAPIVLANWRIEIEPDMVGWRNKITLSWRKYKLMHYTNREGTNPSSTAQLLLAAKSIASELYIFNAAKDEEHMEALMLLSMRPTNGIQN